MNRTERVQSLKTALKERILVLDGAMGTSIQVLYPEYDGCNEELCLTRPELIEKIHQSFIDAGADILETNTFGGTPLVLAEYQLEKKAHEINQKAAELARKVAGSKFVAGSMGPTTKAISVTGGVTFEELIQNYYVQAKGLHAGGVDYFLVETAQDTRNLKAALFGIQKLFQEGLEEIPIAISGTIEATGTMLAGQSIESLYTSLAHVDLLYIGLNCATGPEFMTDHVRTLSQISKFPVACVPNAGLPDEDGKYLETPKTMGEILHRFVDSKWVNVIGGCCGTTPDHIRKFAELVKGKATRTLSSNNGSFVSGIDFLEIAEGNRPVLVGERTNVIGSRRFKKMIEANDFDSAVEVGRGQMKKGAQILDICLANPDRDEVNDMQKFLEKAIRSFRVPLMIDSTDVEVFSIALPYIQGKSILNSINLEDGEERFEKVIPLAKKYGTSLVVGTIDEDPKQGMAITRVRKLEVAKRSYKLLTEKYGIQAEDIYFDALVFPCATGDAQYIGSAEETIEGVRLLKEHFPKCKTILGISNVSFGLPDAGREVLNSVFLYHCTKAGLDLAIVNTELLQRYPSIPEKERELAEEILFNRGENPIARFTEYFRSQKPKKKVPTQNLSLHERLSLAIVEGSKEGLIDNLNSCLKKEKPLQIINGPLMAGMDEVGRLFNNNELIVAEVLQSAEVMKAAVTHLEQFMEKTETSIRGKVLLATVKGDVHDIGKNLVEIVLANNGFNVVNLGIKIAPETLIQAVKEQSPHIIGLSGLLVKSAQQMVTTAEDLAKAGIQIPILVGGAALTRSFVDRRIAKAYSGTVAYASDAMNGLELAKIIVDEKKFETFKTELEDKQKKAQTEMKTVQAPEAEDPTKRSNIVPLTRPPLPPDFDRHIIDKTPIEHLWAYINPRMLLGRHLGLPNSLISFIEKKDLDSLKDMDAGKKAIEIVEAVEEVKAESKKLGLLTPKAVYQFYEAQSDGSDIFIFDRNRQEKIARFSFPRQKQSPYFCISDYQATSDSAVRDNLALFVVTAGKGVRQKAEEWKNKGEYLKSHILSALALETAEGYAEWLHAKLRGLWGSPDPAEMTMMEKFQAKYKGRRYSFGYPACPELAQQKILFDLLHPEEIGVELTEQYMMDPEASVSAIVIHHPEATYFSV